MSTAAVLLHKPYDMKPQKQSTYFSTRKQVKGKKQSIVQISKEEMLSMIADAGYETAPDILFPETGKKKKFRIFAG